MIFDRLGLTPIINGVGPATRLGGLPLSDEVLQAMREATRTSVRMDELELAVGRRLAELLGVAGAYVTPGASAALSLATAAVLAQGSAEISDQLPLVEGGRNRVVIQHAHRDPYDHAVSAVGGRIVEFGFPGSTHPDELRRALRYDTAAVLFRPGRPGNLLDLTTVAGIAHAANVPVIVDGALHVPPVERLQKYFADGADLVAVSGGKGFRGPQASGLLCGDPRLLEMAALQHQDMDERASTWRPVTGESPPRHGVGRGMKVGREQIAGLLCAVERHVRAAGADEKEGLDELSEVEGALRGVEGLAISRGFDDALNVPVVYIDVTSSGSSVDDVLRRLAEGSPRVYVGEELAWRNTLTVAPMALLPGEGRALAAAVKAAI
jgi:L-seryl-tRNA(Ser) seleniumtransferase